MRRARHGDHEAFGELICRQRALAVRLCTRATGDAGLAEDAVQEGILQAWLSLDKLRQPEQFGAWLAGIALRVCHRRFRYRAHETWSLEALVGGRWMAEPIDPALQPQQTIEVEDLRLRVRSAVTSLPPGQRAAVALFYLADLSYAETADLLGIDTGAVKARLHKARGNLRRSLWELRSEERMPDIQYVDVLVEDVRAVPIDEPPHERKVILLAEGNGERVLPVWVGGFEGDAIAIGMLRAETIRPLTFSFAARLLEAAGGRLREVKIERLVDGTFYAQVVVESTAGSRTIDARPSDAIALALEAEAPIRVSKDVMDMAGVAREDLKGKAPESRSAREHSGEIRERLKQRKTNWARSTLF